MRGKPAQFVLHQRKQLLGSDGIALLRGFQDARDITHAFQSSAPRWG
jgi:hypothetical protein